MGRRKDYIPAPKDWKDMFSQYGGRWTPVDKIPVENIKIDKRLMSYPNNVDYTEVRYIVDDFHIEGWMPITVNEDYYLLDGQHRLAAAKQLGLKYIDVVVQREID